MTIPDVISIAVKIYFLLAILEFFKKKLAKRTDNIFADLTKDCTRYDT